jgi:hypothetical protein
MAGYSTMARVRGGRVRALAVDGAPGLDRRQAPARIRPVAGLPQDAGPTLGERLASLREELGMMTFYLLDPQSWR